VIPRVRPRSASAREVLRYLFGPGDDGEHHDQRLVGVWETAAIGGVAELQPLTGGGTFSVGRLAELLEQPFSLVTTLRTSRSGIARFTTILMIHGCRISSGDRSLPRSSRGLAWPRPAIEGRCGGRRSAMVTVTFIWWRRWCVRTARRSGPATISGAARRWPGISKGSWVCGRAARTGPGPGMTERATLRPVAGGAKRRPAGGFEVGYVGEDGAEQRIGLADA
jgi:hypothetical protein